MELNKIYNLDCIEGMKMLPAKSINCCVTSPPYWSLRDYGVDGQLGLEPTLQEYINKMVDVFREVWRVLRDDGTVWLNLGDSYAGSGKGAWLNKTAQKDNYVPNPGDAVTKCRSELKSKNLIGIPWRVAFALQDYGWYLRQDIIWHKPNPIPESVIDRCTKAHEYMFLLSKSQRYYYDQEAIKEPTVYPVGSRTEKKRGDFKGKYHAHEDFKHISDSFRAIRNERNKRDVWTVATTPFRGAHFATFPRDLIKPCILAGCPKDGVVLDPFMGSGTTALEAYNLGRNYIGFDINRNYCDMANSRTREQQAQVRFGI